MAELDGKCPYCMSEMEPGFIQSSKFLIWDTVEAELFVLPSTNGFRLTNGLFSKHSVKSNYCKKCGVLITPLPQDLK